MAINAGGVLATLDLDTGQFASKLTAAQSSIDGFAGKLGGHSAAFKDTGKALTLGVTAPIVGVGLAAIKLGTDFDYGMSEVKAISGSTGADMQKLEGIAREMGATTKFSASDAADGLKFMAM